MDDDDGLAVGAQPLEELDDRPLGDGVDPGKGLVHDVELGLLGEGPGEEDALLLTAGELADLTIGELAHPDLVQAGHRGVTLRLAGPPKPAELAVLAHHHDVDRRRREVPVDRAALRDVGDQTAHLPVGPTKDLDPAGRQGDEPEDRLEQRALAGPVRSDDRRQAPRLDIEVDIPEHRRRAVGDDQIPHGDRPSASPDRGRCR